MTQSTQQKSPSQNQQQDQKFQPDVRAGKDQDDKQKFGSSESNKYGASEQSKSGSQQR